MTVERDIAGFALPFAAGTALAAAIFRVGYSFCPISILPLLCIWGISMGILAYSRQRQLKINTLWFGIIVLSLASGILTGLTEAWLHIAETAKNGLISDAAHRFCAGLRNLIAEVPFRSDETPAIITALITGDKSALSTWTILAFRESGASHILALSGLHLGIIYGMIRICLSVLGNSPKIRVTKSIIAVLACGFYCIGTGASPSIVRALIFIIAGEAANILGRHRSIRQVLFTALMIQLVFNPADIREIGFQLSYAAMFGIAYIYPPLQRLWSEEKHASLISKALRWLWNSMAISISCQLTTAPLALYYFGTYPEYFLLTNLIALPLVSIIIPIGLATIGLYAIGICPDLLIQATETMTELMRKSLEIIATM
jgi:competence protein ComEC